MARHVAEGRTSGKARPVLPTLKLGTYDGTACLKTFLAKFENCSDYYEWTDRERLCHLRASLEGPAGQVLWDAGEHSSVDAVIRLLKNRFGSLNEEERYRSELKARRRRRGESLQSVYQDVRRLMAMAFPGQTGPLWEVMARDAFAESLGDPLLRLRVLERDPTTLEEALKIATRLEALGYGEVEENWDKFGRSRGNFVKGATPDGYGETRELTNMMQQMRKELEQTRAEVQRLKDDSGRQRDGSEFGPGTFGHRADFPDPNRPAQYPDHRFADPGVGCWYTPPTAPPPTPPVAPPLAPQPQGQPVPASWFPGTTTSPAGHYAAADSGQHNNSSNERRGVRRRSTNREDGACYYCHQRGHWKAECPERQRRAHGVSTQSGTRTYLRIVVAGRASVCLLDTGCERSMLPRRYVPYTELAPTDVKVFAANGTKIPVVGTTMVRFEVAGRPVQCHFLVSDAVDEPMLGIDWLEANLCRWDFQSGTLTVAGTAVPLVSKPRGAVVRRVYVEQNVTVPPRTQVEVPVRLAWTAYERTVNDTEWVLESKQLSPGVVVARCLLPKEDSRSHVRAINLTDQTRRIPAELCMGGAWPAERVEREKATPRQIPPHPASHPATAPPPSTDHVRPAIDTFSDRLTGEQLTAATQLVHQYADIFSQSEFDLGRCEILPHRIDTGEARPFKEQLRRHPIAHLNLIDNQVDQMLRAGVIEPSASPWSSNVVLEGNQTEHIGSA